jgi:hypothetical protein
VAGLLALSAVLGLLALSQSNSRGAVDLKGFGRPVAAFAVGSLVPVRA